MFNPLTYRSYGSSHQKVDVISGWGSVNIKKRASSYQSPSKLCRNGHWYRKKYES